jgi:hypothetical protein
MEKSLSMAKVTYISILYKSIFQELSVSGHPVYESCSEMAEMRVVGRLGAHEFQSPCFHCSWHVRPSRTREVFSFGTLQ